MAEEQRKEYQLINNGRFSRFEKGKLVKYKAGTENDKVLLTSAEAAGMTNIIKPTGTDTFRTTVAVPPAIAPDNGKKQ